MSPLRIACLLVWAVAVRAELPVARLHSLFPPGGQQGTSLQVTAEGADLDDPSSLRFNIPGLSTVANATNGPGVFTVSISSNTPPGVYEARVAGRFGLSNPRFFTVGTCAEVAAAADHHSAEKAMPLGLETTVNALATAAAADFYKFDAKTREPIALICQADPFDSRMTPVLLLFNSQGAELLRNRHSGRLDFTPEPGQSYLVKVHDLQFRGGKQFPYRLTISTHAAMDAPPRLTRLPVHFESGLEKISEQESNDRLAQRISPPCEVQGRFYPERDVDRFEFEAKKGESFWIDVRSERLGESTAPFVLVQKVTHKEKGEESVSDVAELYGSDSNLGGQFFNTATRDPVGRLEVKEDGLYRLQVRDLFNTHPDARRSYQLIVRREDPGFDLVALVLPHPDFNKDNRQAQIWSTFVRRGETTLLKVLALRRDGFNGEINLRVEGLPAGLQASDSSIAEGQNAGWLSITADAKASDWTGPIRIVGKGKSGTNTVEQAARSASIVWDIPDYNNESVRSRLQLDSTLAASTDTAPFAIELKQASWQIPQLSTQAIPLHLARSAEFKQAVKIRAYVDLQNDPVKEWQVDAAAADTNFDLDLKQAKLSTGPHLLYFLSQTGGKIRRVRADEVPALEAAAKQDESQRKRIEERLQWRDVSGTFSSPVVKIFINPAPTAAK